MKPEVLVPLGLLAYAVIHVTIGVIYLGICRGLNKDAFVDKSCLGDTNFGIAAVFLWFVFMPWSCFECLYCLVKAKTEAIVKASEERTRARSHEVPKWSEK